MKKLAEGETKTKAINVLTGKPVDWLTLGLGQRPDRVIAIEIGVTAHTVGFNRQHLGIPVFQKTKNPIDWNSVGLGECSDAEIGRRLGVASEKVTRHRNLLGIPTWSKYKIDWNALPLGTKSDSEIARDLGIDHSIVSLRRSALGIPPFKRTKTERIKKPEKVVRDWSLIDLGARTDQEIADELHTHKNNVTQARHRLGIPAFNRKIGENRKKIQSISWENQPLGVESDHQIALKLGVSRLVVSKARNSRNIPSVNIDWDKQPLGQVPDRMLALSLGRNPATIHEARVSRGIPRGDLKFQTPEGEPANFSEALIDLHWHIEKIPHKFQVRIGSFIADWVLGDRVVEYAGYERKDYIGDIYKKKLARKLEYYHANNWKTQVITPAELSLYNHNQVPPIQPNVDWNKVPFGTMPDEKLAKQLGVSKSKIGVARRRMGIPSWSEQNAKAS